MLSKDGVSSPDVRGRNFVAEALSNHFAIERLNILISLRLTLGLCVKFCIANGFDEFPLKKVKDSVLPFCVHSDHVEAPVGLRLNYVHAYCCR